MAQCDAVKRYLLLAVVLAGCGSAAATGFVPTKGVTPLTAPGIYRVGVDIPAGVWQSDAVGDNCYWATFRDIGVGKRVVAVDAEHTAKKGEHLVVPILDPIIEFQWSGGCAAWRHVG